MTTPRHNRAPALLACAAIVVSLALLGVAVLAWRAWSTFAAAVPAVAWSLQLVAFGALAAAPVVGLVIAWRAIDAHHTERTTLARRNLGLPHNTSLNIHLTAPAALSGPHSALQLPPPAGPATPPSLIDAISRGLSTPEQWLIGAAADGQPQTIALKHTGFIALVGVQGTGKTNAEALLAAQCAATKGGTIFVADPQAGDPQSLSNRLAPLAGAIRETAKTPDEINAMIATVGRMYARRNAIVGNYPPLLILVDEFMGLMIRRQLSDEALAVLIALSGEGRKKNMFAALASQNWNMAALGRSGVTIRQNTTAALVFKSKRETAEVLLPLAYAQQALTLRPGQALFFGADEPIPIAVPWLSDSDMAYAARGRVNIPVSPPSPVLSPHSAPQGTLAPTVRVPVPPTVPMLLTVPERILLELDGGRFMTASELAAALGVDLMVVRVELVELSDAGKLVKRRCAGRTTKERFEYGRLTINRISGPLAVSA